MRHAQRWPIFHAMNCALPRQRRKATEPNEIFGWRCYCLKCRRWFLHLCDEDFDAPTADGRWCCALPPRCAYSDCASTAWNKPRKG